MSTPPASGSFPASFLIQQNNHFFIAGASGAWNIHVFFVWFWQARKYLLSSSEWQASVRSVKLRSTTLCTGVFLFYIKRHLMSGNEFACSLGSSSAIIAWVWTQKTCWKTRADIRPSVYGPLVCVLSLSEYINCIKWMIVCLHPESQCCRAAFYRFREWNRPMLGVTAVWRLISPAAAGAPRPS